MKQYYKKEKSINLNHIKPPFLIYRKIHKTFGLQTYEFTGWDLPPILWPVNRGTQKPRSQGLLGKRVQRSLMEVWSQRDSVRSGVIWRIGGLPMPGQRLEGPGCFDHVTSASVLKLKLCASEVKWRPTWAQRQAQKFCKQPHYRMTWLLISYPQCKWASGSWLSGKI